MNLIEFKNWLNEQIESLQRRQTAGDLFSYGLLTAYCEVRERIDEL